MSQRKTIHDTNERRARQRFQIGQDVRYKCLTGGRLSDAGAGKILDVSSKGVRFTTECALKPGTRLELSIDWPARLNDTCLLKLMIYGRVIRSEESAAAVKIEHYEFRTRASTPCRVLGDPLNYPQAI